jgi:hypothetical protein
MVRPKDKEKPMRAFVILCCVLLAAAAHGDESERKKSEAEATTPSVSAAPPAYVPPQSIGAPRNRMVGAATRSARLPGPTLYSLVPEHTGQTVSAQPSLFWYLDTLPSEDTPVYFTLTNEQEIDPIAEIQLPKVAKAGIQRVDLAQHGIKLEHGTEYEWTIAVVVDPDQRANDVVTAGWVIVVEEPAGLEPSARSYAAHGLWYDAIAAAPDDFRADLLRDVGLGKILDRPSPE